jgi:hypothetical protein
VSAFGGLDLCACKRGFFTLRDCANPASGSCSVCTRRVCAQHLTQGSACVECVAKRDEEEALGPDVDPTLGAVRYRTSWYRSSGYSPMWWGTSDSYYSDTDYRWYDDSGDDRDDDGGGFEDS